jgi:hypothetical protein
VPHTLLSLDPCPFAVRFERVRRTLDTFSHVNRPGCERIVRRLVVCYLAPALDRPLVRECAAGSHPLAADRHGDVSVRGDVDHVAQPRLGGSLHMSFRPLRPPLSPIDARASYMVRNGRIGP